MKKKILVSGLGGSLFPNLHDSIKEKYIPYYVDNNPIVLILYPDYNVKLAPAVTDPGYPGFIKKLIIEKSIDFYLPLIDEEILLAHQLCRELQQVFLISPQLEFSELCLNKYNLMKELASNGVSVVNSWMGHEFKNETNFPLLVKPVSGRGSRGVRLIHSQQELDAYYILERYRPEEVLIQEVLDGSEYTIGLTTNFHDQILSITPKKVISKKGITIEAVIDNHKGIFELCEKLNFIMKPKGAINIQLFLTRAGELKVFEINPRFSTTSIMSFQSGIDEISLLIDQWQQKVVAPFLVAKNGLRLIRRWENLFYEN